jgi:hypothetical protein
MNTVNVAIYFNENNRDGDRLEGILQELAPSEEIRAYRSVDDLSRSLRQPGHTFDIVVLVPATGRELLNLLRIRYLLTDLRIVLILPDRLGDTIARGHTLYPRYISYAHGDFSDVAAVLEKMLQRDTEPLRSALHP